MNQGDKLTRNDSNDFDSLCPIEKISGFVHFTDEVNSRFTYNNDRVSELDIETQDILHYIEMSGITKGRADVYKRLEKIRQERRRCKNENDMLKPIHDWIEHNKAAIQALSRAQGSCSNVKNVVSNRMYSVRTDALNDL